MSTKLPILEDTNHNWRDNAFSLLFHQPYLVRPCQMSISRERLLLFPDRIQRPLRLSQLLKCSIPLWHNFTIKVLVYAKVLNPYVAMSNSNITWFFSTDTSRVRIASIKHCHIFTMVQYLLRWTLLKFFNSFFDNSCHEVVPGSWINHARSDLKGGGASPVP